jgi:quinol monooxygenase YgiN
MVTLDCKDIIFIVYLQYLRHESLLTVSCPELDAADAGDGLFMDVFRRADKNDDNKISYAEFISYFQDDHLSNEDMSAIFEKIDTDKSKNIELDELVTYFKGGFECYKQLFSSLEATHRAISAALHSTRQTYSTLSNEEQYKIRFYLREFLFQLEALHRPVDVALDKIAEATPRRRQHSRLDLKDFAPQQALNQQAVFPVGFGASVTALGSLGGFGGLGGDGGLSAGVAASQPPSLHHEVNRLAALIGRLERSRTVKFDMPEEDSALGASTGDGSEAFVVVCTELDVESEHHATFVELTKPYVSTTRLSDGCKYVYVKRKGDEHHTYFLYEIFTSKDSQKAQYKSAHYREWAKALIDVLRKPAAVNSMFLPAEWWPSDDGSDDEL